MELGQPCANQVPSSMLSLDPDFQHYSVPPQGPAVHSSHLSSFCQGTKWLDLYENTVFNLILFWTFAIFQQFCLPGESFHVS